MAGRKISVKKYVVRLSSEERQRIFDDEKEAKLIALAFSKPPKGRCALDAAAVGEQGRGTRHRRSRERLNNPAHAKNCLKPHRRQCWVIPPKANSAFVAAMEDVLAVYVRPHAWPGDGVPRRDFQATHRQDARADPDETRTCCPYGLQIRAQWHREPHTFPADCAYVSDVCGHAWCDETQPRLNP